MTRTGFFTPNCRIKNNGFLRSEKMGGVRTFVLNWERGQHKVLNLGASILDSIQL